MNQTSEEKVFNFTFNKLSTEMREFLEDEHTGIYFKMSDLFKKYGEDITFVFDFNLKPLRAVLNFS